MGGGGGGGGYQLAAAVVVQGVVVPVGTGATQVELDFVSDEETIVVGNLRGRVGDGTWAVGNGNGSSLGQGKLLLRINSGVDRANLSHGPSNTTMRKGGGFRAVGRKGSNNLGGYCSAPAGAVAWGSLPYSSASNAGEDGSSGELHFRKFWWLTLVYVKQIERDW